jgi:hypothetical protein
LLLVIIITPPLFIYLYRNEVKVLMENIKKDFYKAKPERLVKKETKNNILDIFDI